MYAEGINHIGQGYLEANEPNYTKVFETRDIFDIYDVEPSPFARGKFGTVRRVVDKKTGVKYAAKFLRRRRRDQCLSKDINHEIAVLMLCSNSQHIINLHAVHETRLETALILELAHGGELQTLLDIEGCLTENQTIFCLNEILKALQFMHKNNIAHLDVKPQNILMHGENIEDGLKLCDFGISRVIDKACEVREIVGTPDYVAPEVLQYDPVSLRTDIWSVGVLAYVLLSGCSPFAGDSKQETFLNISKCNLTFPNDLFEDVSSHAIDFITDTLQIRPLDRLDVEECLNHKWLTTMTPSTSLACKEITGAFCHNGGSSHSDSGHSTESVLDTVDEVSDATETVTNVTIALVHRRPPTPPATITSCTIGKNGSIIVEEVDEIKLMERQQNGLRMSKGDDKENVRHYCLADAETAPAVFPDAPTTPKVIRKVAPIYSMRTKCNGATNGSGPGTTEEELINRGSVTVTVTINGDDRHASTTRIHICPPD